MRSEEGEGCIWAKWGPVLCLLAFGDSALTSKFLLALGAHKKGCDNDTFRAIFPSIWVSWDTQILQNKGKRKMTNRPCFTRPQPCGIQEGRGRWAGRKKKEKRTRKKCSGSFLITIHPEIFTN